MRFCFPLLVLLAAGIGCDIPFKESKVYSISGLVDLGTPISGATITAYAWPKEIDQLGSTTADAQGNFSLKLSTSYTGSVHLVVSGGSFKNPVSDLPVVIDSKSGLSFFIPILKENTEANINAWTSIASARAVGTVGKCASAQEAMEKSLLAIRQHLGEISITTRSCDLLSVDCQASRDSLLSSLSQIGLSQIAQNNAISTLDLILLLSKDVSDGLFDGRKGDEALYIDQENTKKLDAHLVGFELAKAIDQYLNHLGTKTQSPVLFDKLRPLLEGQNGFYASLSMKKNVDLFPEAQETKPFVTDITSVIDEMFNSGESNDQGPINVIFDLGSSFYDFKNDSEDIGFSDYSTLDIFNFATHPVLKSGFTLAHAVVSNLMNETARLVVTSPFFELEMLRRSATWSPMRNPDAEKEKLCAFQESSYGPEGVPLEVVSVKINEFFPATGNIGAEIQQDDDGNISISPKQAILIRWRTRPQKRTTHSLLPKGQLPTDSMCHAILHKSYVKTCGDIPLEAYALDVCSGDSYLTNGSYVQYELVRGFEVNLSRDLPYVSYWVRRANTKGEHREANAKGPLRSILR